MSLIGCLLVLGLICAGLIAIVVGVARGAGYPGGNAASEGDGGDGGSARPEPPAPRRPSGPTDPVWWPQFERELAEYVARRSRRVSTADGAASAGQPKNSAVSLADDDPRNCVSRMPRRSHRPGAVGQLRAVV